MLREQIKHFGEATLRWLLQMMNSILKTQKFPKLWRKSKVIAILKTRKRLYITKELQTNLTVVSHIQVVRTYDAKPTEPTDRNYDYRSASWIQTWKVPTTGQLLNLTQHIEDDYERGVVTGTLFVDLSAAYDTISH